MPSAIHGLIVQQGGTLVTLRLHPEFTSTVSRSADCIPDEWRSFLRTLASCAEVDEHTEASLPHGPSHPLFAKALEYATEHSYGTAARSLRQTVQQEHHFIAQVPVIARNEEKWVWLLPYLLGGKYHDGRDRRSGLRRSEIQID